MATDSEQWLLSITLTCEAASSQVSGFLMVLAPAQQLTYVAAGKGLICQAWEAAYRCRPRMQLLAGAIITI